CRRKTGAQTSPSQRLTAALAPQPPRTLCTPLHSFARSKAPGRAVWCTNTTVARIRCQRGAHGAPPPPRDRHARRAPCAPLSRNLSAQSITKMAKLALALALAPAVTAFAPVAAPKASTQLQASIQDTLATMEGPEIFWGSDGVLLGHDEADIKGYDNFDQLAAALSKEGVDLSGGEYTLLAPANSAFDKHNNEVGTPITADVLKYHVIEGKKTMDALNTDQKTLNGGTLTAYRKFRKNWLDGAIIGLKSEGPSKSSNWPSDVECDNGIIQAIDTVLVPGAYEGPR
ncbi:unnamed protein product, partial [Pelagomonas calceolata]